MKIILTTIFVLSLAVSKGQNKLDKAVSEKICICVNQLKDWDEEKFGQCFEKSITDHEDLLLEEMSRLGLDSTEESGYKFGQEVYQRLSVNLVYTCKSYGRLMDDLRFSPFKNLNKDSIKAVIASAEKTAPDARDLDFFTQRGLNYFLSDQHTLALADFNSAIQLDKEAFQSIFLKAWTLEKLKKYDEAISLYNQVATSTGKSEFKIFAAISDQKKKGLL